jgi:hypothetical protein
VGIPLARPIAPESYGGMAEIEAQQGAKTGDEHEVTWEEDTVYAWKAVALFGGLLLVESLLLFAQATAPGGTAGIGIHFAFVSGLLFVAATPVAIWGYSEAALSFIGAAAVGVVLGLAYPFSGTSLESEFVLVLGLAGAGLALLLAGLVRSFQVSDRIDADE